MSPRPACGQVVLGSSVPDASAVEILGQHRTTGARHDISLKIWIGKGTLRQGSASASQGSGALVGEGGVLLED